jgi:cell division protein ZipA
MDFFGQRGVLIVVGVLVLLALVLDGLRRIKRNRYENLQMSSRKLQKSAANNSDEKPESYADSQFPSGGSRVVGIRDDDDLQEVEDILRGLGPFGSSAQARQEQLDLDSSVVELDPEQQDIQPKEADTQAQSSSSDSQAAPQPQNVLVLHLMAASGLMINGQALLDAVLAVGFRFGGRKIFDRHINSDGSGEILFSLANVANPGTFDLNTIAELNTPGVTLFMDLEGIEDPVSAFDIMIESVDSLVTELSLNVLDESRSSMTKQTIDHYRQRARSVSFKRNQGN